MRSVSLVAIALALSSLASAQSAHYIETKNGTDTAALPDPKVTPGATRPDATTQSVCHGGSTKKFRNTTSAMKANSYKAYGAVKVKGKCCEVDHLISLELGGADDPKNLWPEPYEPRPGAHEKDTVENFLHAEVCAGHLTLAEAQKEISTNWLSVYERMKTK